MQYTKSVGEPHFKEISNKKFARMTCNVEFDVLAAFSAKKIGVNPRNFVTFFTVLSYTAIKF